MSRRCRKDMAMTTRTAQSAPCASAVDELKIELAHIGVERAVEKMVRNSFLVDAVLKTSGSVEAAAKTMDELEAAIQEEIGMWLARIRAKTLLPVKNKSN